MNETSCEKILTAMMAVFEGEETEFSPEQLNAHFVGCRDCRNEIEKIQKTFILLKNRRVQVQEK